MLCHLIVYVIVLFSDFSKDESETSRSLAGVAVIVVMTVMFVMAGMAYIYHRRTGRQPAEPSYGNPLYYTTETPLSEDKDNKILVEHMENNE